MNNFTYCNTTELVFGRGAEEKTGALAARWADEDKKALVVYGGGSAVKSGLLDRVVASLTAAGLTVATLGGVEPNPKAALVREAAAKVRAEGVSVLVAVGGGSVIDTAKAASAAALYDGDFWDFFTGKAVPQQALPVLAVLTIPAAGSESSIRMVVSEGEEKLGCGCPLVRPKAAVINPELFFTLPQKQVSAGVIDMMSHIMERYFTNTADVEFVSGQAEAALRTIMENGLKLMEDPKDYAAWSEIGLAGTFAHNGFFGLGVEEDWACHGIEHAVSGWNSRVTHGEGLAVIIPAWMRFVWATNPERFVRFAKNVMGVTDDVKSVGDEAFVELAIARFTVFEQKMKLPVRFSDLGVGEIPVETIAELATRHGALGHFRTIGREDVAAILTAAL